MQSYRVDRDKVLLRCASVVGETEKAVRVEFQIKGKTASGEEVEATDYAWFPSKFVKLDADLVFVARFLLESREEEIAARRGWRLVGIMFEDKEEEEDEQ